MEGNIKPDVLKSLVGVGGGEATSARTVRQTVAYGFVGGRRDFGGTPTAFLGSKKTPSIHGSGVVNLPKSAASSLQVFKKRT